MKPLKVRITALDTLIRGLDRQIEVQQETLALHVAAQCRCHTSTETREFKCDGMQRAIEGILDDLSEQRFNACKERAELLDLQKENDNASKGKLSKPKTKRKPGRRRSKQ